MGSDNSPKRPVPSSDADEELEDEMQTHHFDPDDVQEDFIEEIIEVDDVAHLEDYPESDEEPPPAEEPESEPIRDDALLTFREHSGPVFCASFHPTESLAVSGSEDDCAYVWRSDTGEIVHKCEGHSDTVVGASFSHDGTYLATGDLGGFLQVFRVSDAFKQVWNFNIGDMSWMKWHKASNVLMAGTESGEVYFWRIPSGDCKVLQSRNSKAECGSLTCDAKRMVVGYADGCVTLWDIKTATALQTITVNAPLGHSDGVLCVATDPEGSLFASGGSDGHLVIASSAGPLGRITVGSSVECIAFAPAESLKLLATGTLSGKVTVWDVSRQSPRCECRDENMSGVTELLWTSDMTLLAATLDGSVKAFEGRSGQLKNSYLGHRREIYDMQMDKSGQFLLTASEDGTAKIFRLTS